MYDRIRKKGRKIKERIYITMKDTWEAFLRKSGKTSWYNFENYSIEALQIPLYSGSRVMTC